MGRGAEPTDLILMKGKKHLTQEEIKRRKSAEIKLTNQKIRPDPLVLADGRALKEFKYLKRLYKEIAFVGTLDSHIINQYCLAVSELDDMVTLSAEARAAMKSPDGARRKAASGPFLELDKALRQKRAEILRMSDRLYLNPVARTKNLPRREETQDDPNAGLFGDTG